MRVIVARALVLVVFSVTIAAGQTEAEKFAAAKAERQKFIKEKHPLRVIGGKLYDFTPLINSKDEDAYSTWVVHGKVLQVTDDGLLVKRGSLTVHLRNYRNQSSVIDGSEVICAAAVVGRYQYTTVSGSKSTVVDYDCGTYWDYKEKFSKKTLVMVWTAEAQEVPVWKIDLP
jgi:hypothetical protein